MQLALQQAQLAAAAGEVPVGAVVVHNGAVVGRGFNRPIASHDPTAHAEIMALREAAAQLGNYRLPEADLYVTLEPCLMCCGALVHARIRCLYFGANEPKTGAVVSQTEALSMPHHNHAVRFEGGLLAQQSSEMLRDFFRRRRGKNTTSRC